MGWMSAVRREVSVLITPGYLPDRCRIDESLTRYFGRNVGEQDVPEDAEERTAWLLGSLARRHVGYYYKRKQQMRDLVLDTWVIGQSKTNRGGFEEWFTLPAACHKDFRLYLHAYPRSQVGCTLATNIFAYPHKQLGTRRGRHAGEVALRRRESSQKYLQRLAETYALAGEEAMTSLLRETHRVRYSPGTPARLRSSLS